MGIANTDDTLRSTFMSLPDRQLELYIERASEFLQGTGRSWSEDNHDQVLFITAFYLCQLDAFTNERPKYPYYAVHSQDKDWRFETASARLAFNKFKNAIRDGERVGMFHWESRSKCVKTHASEGYAFERDFGAAR